MFGEVRLKAVAGMIPLESSKVPVEQFKQSLSGGGFRVDDEVGRALIANTGAHGSNRANRPRVAWRERDGTPGTGKQGQDN